MVVCGVDSDRRLLYDSRGELTALVMDDRRLLLAVVTEDGEFSWLEVHDDSVLILLPNLLLAAELGCKRLFGAGSLLMIGFDREKLDFSADVLLMADGFVIRFDPPNFTSDSCEWVLSVLTELCKESPSESTEISKSVMALFLIDLFCFAGEARLSRDMLVDSLVIFLGLPVGRFKAGLELRELSLDDRFFDLTDSDDELLGAPMVVLLLFRCGRGSR